MDHNYCVADSSSDLLGAIWALDMTDAVPFSVTEMELSPHAGGLNFEDGPFAIASLWWHPNISLLWAKEWHFSTNQILVQNSWIFRTRVTSPPPRSAACSLQVLLRQLNHAG